MSFCRFLDSSDLSSSGELTTSRGPNAAAPVAGRNDSNNTPAVLQPLATLVLLKPKSRALLMRVKG